MAYVIFEGERADEEFESWKDYCYEMTEIRTQNLQGTENRWIYVSYVEE